ncbi:MAG: PTS sugar transporter subunit IIC [Candidatus Eisenbacteria bacterium]
MSEIQMIVVLSLLGGALSVDATAAFQIMLSQPLVAGSIAGAIVGDLGLGLAVGATLQLVWMGALPVGAAPFPDGAVAGVAGVGAGAILVRSGVPEGLAIAGAVVVGLCAGSAGQKVTSGVRRLNVRYSTLARSRADDGDPQGVTAAVVLGLVTRFATAALLAAVALSVSLLLRPLASVGAIGVFPTTLWAAPIAAAAIAAGGRAKSEATYIVAGLAAGLAFVLLV